MNIAWTAQKSGARNAPSGTVLWRTFLRGLASELDAQAGPEHTAELLRGAGQQMARLLGLPAVLSLEALEGRHGGNTLWAIVSAVNISILKCDDSAFAQPSSSKRRQALA
jgi:hypothetical protein